MTPEKLERSGKKYISLSLILVLFQISLLFLSSGKINIFRFWVFSSVQIIYLAFSFLFLYYNNYQLLNERGKRKKDSKEWDKKLLTLINISMIFILPIIIGFDHRKDITVIDPFYMIPGFILYTLSNILVLCSMLVNTYFETNVRLQSDRHHKIITRWPYSLIRHPGYSGTILWLTGVPLILGSIIGLFFSLLIIILFVYRTVKEDRFLSENHPDYENYKKEVKYKLIPFVW